MSKNQCTYLTFKNTLLLKKKKTKYPLSFQQRHNLFSGGEILRITKMWYRGMK